MHSLYVYMHMVSVFTGLYVNLELLVLTIYDMAAVCAMQPPEINVGLKNFHCYLSCEIFPKCEVVLLCVSTGIAPLTWASKVCVLRLPYRCELSTSRGHLLPRSYIKDHNIKDYFFLVAVQVFWLDL